MRIPDKQDETTTTTAQKLPGQEGRPRTADAATASATPRGTGARLIREEDLPAGTLEWLTNSPRALPPEALHRGMLAQAVRPATADTVERLEHLIQREIVMVRKLEAESLSVVLKPDGRTELVLELSKNAGGIQAQVSFERGDFPLLQRHWKDLQETLAGQDVKLLPLREPAATSTGTNSDTGARTSPEDSSARHRRDQDVEKPPRDGNGLTRESAPPSRPARSRGTTHRGWETWA